jgi:hypothetical protein
MGLIKFDIRYPNSQRESAVVEGERALIGSASHSDVRLPMDQAAYEHVLIEVHGGTLRAEAKAEKPPATINGMPLSASALHPDNALGVGHVKLFVSFVPDSVDGAALTLKDKKDESSNAIRALALVIFAAAAYLLLTEEDAEIAPPPAEAPALFGSAKAECPETAPAQAAALAKEKLDAADGKRERLPFAVKEGVAAVPLYDLAAACFRVGDDEVRAKEAEDARASLKRSLADDFRARRLRLKHMLALKDFELVKRDVVVLQDMTVDKKGPYVEWLAAVRKQLKSKGVR